MGLEPTAATSFGDNDLRQSLPRTGTETGTVHSETAWIDVDLAEIIEAWPDLPESAKAAVVDLVREAAE